MKSKPNNYILVVTSRGSVVFHRAILGIKQMLFAKAMFSIDLMSLYSVSFYLLDSKKS